MSIRKAITYNKLNNFRIVALNMCDLKSWLLIPLDDLSAWNAVDLSCVFTMKTEKKMVSVTDAYRMLGD